ncbi:Uncharacterized protein ESCO_002932 [Escovopsis weberi]|uniref:Mitochondrial K+-H+ exchange-related-domain-containing protein n=1 Tax=Escovopsis weberi TaxID=150374 RepID=A0A0M9VT28_ESCWE|nr:Uncharacterized protein ESCO_002932 [Escovopsis weberi]
MRLYLLPVSTRRTLLYAQRLNVAVAPGERSFIDKGAAWAARKWAAWEKLERGWQRHVVGYGNHAFRRIPLEEWGLKSVPPLSARRREEEMGAGGRNAKGEGARVELVFPPAAIPAHRAEEVVGRLATERQALHRKRMMWCFVGMPIVAPFALVPVIPNIPFFYLAYRAWSHWRALHGGKHIQWLIQNKLLHLCPSKDLDKLYIHNGKGLPEKLTEKVTEEEEYDDDDDHDHKNNTISSNSNSNSNSNSSSNKDAVAQAERLLITREQTAAFSALLDLPTVETELERAIWQVEQSIKGEEMHKGGEGT